MECVTFGRPILRAASAAGPGVCPWRRPGPESPQALKPHPTLRTPQCTRSGVVAGNTIYGGLVMAALFHPRDHIRHKLFLHQDFRCRQRGRQGPPESRSPRLPGSRTGYQFASSPVRDGLTGLHRRDAYLPLFNWLIGLMLGGKASSLWSGAVPASLNCAARSEVPLFGYVRLYISELSSGLSWSQSIPWAIGAPWWSISRERADFGWRNPDL